MAHGPHDDAVAVGAGRAAAPRPAAPVTDDVIAALDLPPAAIGPWLDDIEAFCRAHGGERHYRELLALVAGARAAAARRP